MNTKIVPITDLRRNFGSITSDLPKLGSLLLTRGGEPFAVLKAAPEVKKKLLKKAKGVWKGTDLDKDSFWKMALVKKSRKHPVVL